ncbi:uncharacterized protein [Montipora capricornis]|uniref:uncharacterized protein n=1 Tax=Montipora capricornis TaxID=246305 RepID=UPI0035F197A0
MNAFVRTKGHAKQVPLVFVPMSGRKKKDYRKVLKTILDLLPIAPDVQQVTLDFEKAMWAALRMILPDVQIKGCVFHLTQALWRKIQELGLQQQYISDKGTYAYLRKIMALAFLPESEITPMFEMLRQEASTAPLQQFVEYVADIWIYGNTWPPSSWSIFMMAVRTNNDIEGWHHALNRRAAGRWQMPFYLLIELLHREAKISALQIRLVSEKKLKRIQRKNYRSLQSKIFDLWENYLENRTSAQQLLRACRHLNGPVRSK